MNKTFKMIMALIFVAAIVISSISICRSISKSLGLKWDITDQKLYTLSKGTKSILAKLNQPITVELFYAKTAAMKAPDQIRFFNNYYQYVKDLLDEYVAQSHGKVKLRVIDPRPYSDAEEEALRYGLKRFPITKDESFFFGLIVKTPFGAVKTIPFFSPERQNFVEYDISYLIDTVIAKQKKKIGVLSSLPVMGDDVSGYMAQMLRIQGKQPKPPWVIIQQLRQKYDVVRIPTDTKKIKDIDVLLVIQPKKLSEQTLFAIDQYVLRGGRAIVCVDPYCLMDKPNPMARMQGRMPSSSSDLNQLLKNWGVEMPVGKFAGDENLAMSVPLRRGQMPQKVIGFLDFTSEAGCFNKSNVITGNLNQVIMLLPGILKKTNPNMTSSDKVNSANTKKVAGKAGKGGSNSDSGNVVKAGGKKIAQSAKAGTLTKVNTAKDSNTNNRLNIKVTPLLETTASGNTWQPSSPYELEMMDAKLMMQHFSPGVKPLMTGCLITGRFKSSFPDGIDVVKDNSGGTANAKDKVAKDKKKQTEHITGLKQANADCAVAVFADVDFISNQAAYTQTIFGPQVNGDNSALLMNTIDNLCGSNDLISIRSRGNFRRPFTLVDKIEKQAEQKTAEEEKQIDDQIAKFKQDLQNIVNQAINKNKGIIDASELMLKKRQAELKIREAEKKKRDILNQRRKRVDQLGNELRNINMLLAPGVILVIAIIMGIYRSKRKRRYDE